MPKPQATSNSSKVSAKKQDQKAATANGKVDAKARKELTGRERQGNHDSLTKSGPSGGAKGDRHDNGIRQAGRAGK